MKNSVKRHFLFLKNWIDNSNVENMVVEYISSRPNGFPVTNPLVLLKFDFSKWGVFKFFCLSRECLKNWCTIVFADPRNNYAAALEKPAVKPVARLHNIITSCQSSKVFTVFKFVGDITISSQLKSIKIEMFHD